MLLLLLILLLVLLLAYRRGEAYRRPPLASSLQRGCHTTAGRWPCRRDVAMYTIHIMTQRSGGAAMNILAKGIVGGLARGIKSGSRFEPVESPTAYTEHFNMSTETYTVKKEHMQKSTTHLTRAKGALEAAQGGYCYTTSLPLTRAPSALGAQPLMITRDHWRHRLVVSHPQPSPSSK